MGTAHDNLKKHEFEHCHDLVGSIAAIIEQF